MIILMLSASLAAASDELLCCSKDGVVYLTLIALSPRHWHTPQTVFSASFAQELHHELAQQQQHSHLWYWKGNSTWYQGSYFYYINWLCGVQGWRFVFLVMSSLALTVTVLVLVFGVEPRNLKARGANNPQRGAWGTGPAAVLAGVRAMVRMPACSSTSCLVTCRATCSWPLTSSGFSAMQWQGRCMRTVILILGTIYMQC